MATFSDRRLFVGWRAQDWTPVWYEPASEPDEDGIADIGLYTRSIGDVDGSEPMEGEVYYFPTFALAHCESKFKGEKFKLQKRTLYQAWRYMSERNPVRLQRLEEEYHQPKFRRWQSWFELAKKQKHSIIQAAETRKRKREEKMASGKQGLDEDDSDADSAFGDEDPGRNKGGPDKGPNRRPHRGPAPNAVGLGVGLGMRPSSNQPSKKRAPYGPFMDDDDDDDDDDGFSANSTSERFSAFSPPSTSIGGARGRRSANRSIEPAPRSYDHSRLALQHQYTLAGSRTPPRSYTPLSHTIKRNTHGPRNLRAGEKSKASSTGRVLSKPDDSGHLAHRFNGGSDPDQAMQDGIRESRASMLRKSRMRDSSPTETGTDGSSAVKPEAGEAGIGNEKGPNDEEGCSNGNDLGEID